LKVYSKVKEGGTVVKRNFHIYVDAHIEEDAIDPFEIVVPDNNENGIMALVVYSAGATLRLYITKSQARDYLLPAIQKVINGKEGKHGTGSARNRKKPIVGKDSYEREG